jgi:hypothetical protein
MLYFPISRVCRIVVDPLPDRDQVLNSKQSKNLRVKKVKVARIVTQKILTDLALQIRMLVPFHSCELA